jgi:hypothetical protein
VGNERRGWASWPSLGDFIEFLADGVSFDEHVAEVAFLDLAL